MPFYSDDVLDDIRSRNDIVDVISSYVRLKKSGANYFGLCPFHREKSPSFSVNADKQIFHCFGCGAGGNVVSFIMRAENYSFPDALKFLADRVHYQLPEESSESHQKSAAFREILFNINKKAARFFYDALSLPESREAVNYLAERRLTPKTVKKFGLGFSPVLSNGLNEFLVEEGFSQSDIEKSGLVAVSDGGRRYEKFRNRLMFPILDAANRVVGFGGRIIGEGMPKYLNSPDTAVFNKSQNLFAINFARKSKAGEIIIVEGYMDALALFQAGFDNVVASLGTAFNKEHCVKLSQYFKGKTAILLFDGDEAGEKAALRAIPILRKNNIPAKVLRLSAKDPDEFIKANGSEAFKTALNLAESCTVFQIGVVKKKYDLTKTDQKILFLNDAAAVFAELENSIERDAYITDISKETGISAESVKNEVDKRLGAQGTDLMPLISTERLINKPSNAGIPVQKGIEPVALKACASVLMLLASLENEEIYKALKSVITAEEFIITSYIKLFGEIIKIRDANGRVNPAELIDRFDSLDEKNEISAVFAGEALYDDDSALTKMLNQQIKVIKTANIRSKMNKAAAVGDLKTAQKLGETLINLPNSYI